MAELTLSPLGHTWILDLDGTILKHNGYKIDGHDSFVEGAEKFLKSLPEEDMIIFLTARSLELKEETECFFSQNNVNYSQIIYNAPYGERILVNDKKPSGLITAIAISDERDATVDIKIRIDEEL